MPKFNEFRVRFVGYKEKSIYVLEKILFSRIKKGEKHNSLKKISRLFLYGNINETHYEFM